MRSLSAFLFISADGYYKDQHNDIQWHQHGAEELAYSEASIQTGNSLVFGRITYEMMAGFWTSEHANSVSSIVAEGMMKAEKIVCSRTLQVADWNNSCIVKGDLASVFSDIKRSPGPNLTILGSGEIVRQLTVANLIDSYTLMIDPLILGQGTPLFSELRHSLRLKLIGSKSFRSGSVLLDYKTDH